MASQEIHLSFRRRIFGILSLFLGVIVFTFRHFALYENVLQRAVCNSSETAEWIAALPSTSGGLIVMGITTLCRDCPRTGLGLSLGVVGLSAVAMRYAGLSPGELCLR